MSAFNFKKHSVTRLLMTAAAASALAGCLGSNGDNHDASIVDHPPQVVIDYTQDIPAVEWGPTYTVTAFAPAQRSWQWMVKEDPNFSHGDVHPDQAVRGLREDGQTCASCHAVGGIAPPPSTLGANLVGADADPIPGKVGYRDLDVQAAYTDIQFFLKVSWQTQQGRPGATHGLWTYKEGDGSWAAVDKYKPTELLADGYDAYSFEDHLTLMFLPKSVNVPAEPNAAVTSLANFHTVGCWIGCHTDTTAMPEYAGGATLNMYLLSTRVGDWGSDPVDQATIDALKLAGEFPDLWHYRAARTGPVQSTTDAYLLQTRGPDALDFGTTGTNPFVQNEDPIGSGNIKWMYDDAVMGFNAWPRSEWNAEDQNAPPLIIGGPNANAEPFDPGVDFEDGALIPKWALQPVEPGVTGGSRADVKTYTTYAVDPDTGEGTWTVVFERARVTGNADDHDLNPDSEDYTFAFAVYDDHSNVRWHHVTFPVSLGTEGSGADIEAHYNN